ncbi:MAG: hypothetical protein ACKO6B_18340 [Planctomycetia bacterium]
MSEGIGRFALKVAFFGTNMKTGLFSSRRLCHCHSLRSLRKVGGSFWTRSGPARHNAVGGHGGPRLHKTPPISGRSSSATGLSAVQAFLISAVVLGVLVGVGIAAIIAVRAWWLEPETDHGDWESSLVGYKNLRDKGVLSEEEYRKISTLVEPHVRPDTMASGDPGSDRRQRTGTS